MSPFDGYGADEVRDNWRDSAIDDLLREDQAHPDEDLRRFLEALSVPGPPPHDVEQMATALAATARASQRTARHRSLRRLTVLAGVGALVVALSGVAVAADSAVPGDSLYGVDRALESVGLGAGGVDERIAEFDVLLGRGQEERAFSLLGQVVETAEGPDLEKVQQHLELAATKTNTSARAAQEKISTLQRFFAENKGDAGVNGREFGQGVAEIAKEKNWGTDLTERPGADAQDMGDTTKPTKTERRPEGEPPASDNTPGSPDHARSGQNGADASNTTQPSAEGGGTPGDTDRTSGSEKSGTTPGQQKDKKQDR